MKTKSHLLTRHLIRSRAGLPPLKYSGPAAGEVDSDDGAARQKQLRAPWLYGPPVMAPYL
jgi:hypothetical protein